LFYLEIDQISDSWVIKKVKECSDSKYSNKGQQTEVKEKEFLGMSEGQMVFSLVVHLGRMKRGEEKRKKPTVRRMEEVVAGEMILYKFHILTNVSVL
jgi:hypothetical protein